MQSKKIAILGLWHQGIVGAACFASKGFDVLAADLDQSVISSLKEGKSPIFEPGLDDLLAEGIKAQRLEFTSDLTAAVKDRAAVCLMFDTPVDDDDNVDVGGVFSAVKAIAPHLENDVLIFVTCQLPAGSNQKISALIKKINPSLKFYQSFSPENLRLGKGIERFMFPPMPILGAENEDSIVKTKQLFRDFDISWKSCNWITAEVCKHALNSFLALTVTFGNELGNICDEIGADAQRVAELLKLEDRVGDKAMLSPGLAFAGGTLARDLKILRKLGDEKGIDTLLFDGVWNANRQQNSLVTRKLKKYFGRLAGLEVSVLGLTYKPDTSTLRRSPSLEIINDLQRQGAVVRAHDPKAKQSELNEMGFSFTIAKSAEECCRGSQAILLLTPWEEYRSLDFAQMKGLSGDKPFVLDTAAFWDANELEKTGYSYFGIGRGR